MILLTLRRRATEVAGPVACDFCGNNLETPNDHLLVGSPGVATEQHTLCSACGDVIATVADRFGPECALLVQTDRDGVANKLGLPDAVRLGHHEGSRTVSAKRGRRRKEPQTS